MPKGQYTRKPRYVRFEPPNFWLLSDAIGVLKRHGYKEIKKRGRKGLELWRFSVGRGDKPWIHWLEVKPPKLTFAQRVYLREINDLVAEISAP